MTDSGKKETSTQGWQEEFKLPGYGDGELAFTGRIFSEGSFMDEDRGSITRLRLFARDEKRLVYSVVSGSGKNKDRRVYQLKLEDELCQIDNGRQQITLPIDMLFAAVYGICGLAPGQESELKAALEESLSVVSA